MGAVQDLALALVLGAECRCEVKACEYGEALQSCSLRVSDLSSHPNQWLPYAGTKCAAVPGGAEMRKPTCTRKD